MCWKEHYQVWYILTKGHAIAQLLHVVATYFGNFGGYIEMAGTRCIQGGTKGLTNPIWAQTSAYAGAESRGCHVFVTS
jgi:hypothetical protein